ncbi:MAG TPA: aromatic ring-hydroxylating dioxygenase subunit alpha [Stellaceae bacterium]|nr:aromatic ring-hydroxylating dioxygenase subunit alpha [Stellaceae bacterium]
MSADHVDRLRRKPEDAVGLPGHVYSDPNFFRWELENVLGKTWMCVGLTTDVAQPGDLFPINLPGLPILLTRDRAGAVHAFHNLCRHRGVVLVDEPMQGRPTITCPYHAWSYDLAGGCLKTPNIGGIQIHEADGFKLSELGLKRVNCAVWGSLVFINLDGKAPPLDVYLKPLLDRWKGFDPGVLGHAAGMRFELQANWKLAVENFIERYHIPTVHQLLNSHSSYANTFLIDSGVGLFVGVGSKEYTYPDVGGKPLPTFTGIGEDRQQMGDYVALFPNVLLGLQRDHFYALILLPTDVDRTSERFEFFFRADTLDDPETEPTRKALMERRQITNSEDVDIVQRLHRGSISPGFDGARFSPFFETSTHSFQRHYAELVRHAEQPANPSAAAAE